MKHQITEKDLRNPEYRGFWKDLAPSKELIAKAKAAKSQHEQPGQEKPKEISG